MSTKIYAPHKFQCTDKECGNNSITTEYMWSDNMHDVKCHRCGQPMKLVVDEVNKTYIGIGGYDMGRMMDK